MSRYPPRKVCPIHDPNIMDTNAPQPQIFSKAGDIAPEDAKVKRAGIVTGTVNLPTAKERKYDRQLRLWAAAGQQALEESHILLLNGGSGVVGIETLKNLVLPGVGHFTIVDGNVVEEEDLGVNFFLDESSLGKSRAKECCDFLRELNPEVDGNYVFQV